MGRKDVRKMENIHWKKGTMGTIVNKYKGQICQLYLLPTGIQMETILRLNELVYRIVSENWSLTFMLNTKYT